MLPRRIVLLGLSLGYAEEVFGGRLGETSLGCARSRIAGSLEFVQASRTSFCLDALGKSAVALADESPLVPFPRLEDRYTVEELADYSINLDRCNKTLAAGKLEHWARDLQADPSLTLLDGNATECDHELYSSTAPMVENNGGHDGSEPAAPSVTLLHGIGPELDSDPYSPTSPMDETERPDVAPRSPTSPTLSFFDPTQSCWAPAEESLGTIGLDATGSPFSPALSFADPASLNPADADVAAESSIIIPPPKDVGVLAAAAMPWSFDGTPIAAMTKIPCSTSEGVFTTSLLLYDANFLKFHGNSASSVLGSYPMLVVRSQAPTPALSSLLLLLLLVALLFPPPHYPFVCTLGFPLLLFCLVCLVFSSRFYPVCLPMSSFLLSFLVPSPSLSFFFSPPLFSLVFLSSFLPSSRLLLLPIKARMMLGRISARRWRSDFTWRCGMSPML